MNSRVGSLFLIVFALTPIWGQPMRAKGYYGRTFKWRPFNMIQSSPQDTKEPDINLAMNDLDKAGEEDIQIPGQMYELEGFMNELKKKLRREIESLLQEKAEEDTLEDWSFSLGTQSEEKRKIVPSQLLKMI